MARMWLKDIPESIRKGFRDTTDNEPWATLSALADYAEEYGDSRMADVIRWIVRFRRYPNASTEFRIPWGGKEDDMRARIEYYWYPKLVTHTPGVTLDAEDKKRDIRLTLEGNSSHAVPYWKEAGGDASLRGRKNRAESVFVAYWQLINYLRDTHYYLFPKDPKKDE